MIKIKKNANLLWFTMLFSSVFLLSGCSVGEREIIVENCGEPIEINDCKWKGQLFSCNITNNSDALYKGSPIWLYDAEDKLLISEPYLYATGLKPGAMVRQKLPLTKYGDTSAVKVVFCRKDPQQ